MRRLSALVLLAVACAPEIAQDLVPARVVALFDDLAKDPATGLLQVPDAPGASPSIQAQTDAVNWVKP